MVEHMQAPCCDCTAGQLIVSRGIIRVDASAFGSTVARLFGTIKPLML